MKLGNTNFLKNSKEVKMSSDIEKKIVTPSFNSVKEVNIFKEKDVIIVETMTKTITKIYPNGDQHTTTSAWCPENRKYKKWKPKGKKGAKKNNNSKDNSVIEEGEEVL